MGTKDSNEPDNEEDLSAFAEEQQEHAEEIKNIVFDYIEEEEVAEPTVIFALLEMALSIAMSGYVMGTEKPSVTGLKMELDRLGSDVQDMVRDAKKNAAGFLEEALAAVEAQGEEEEE